MIYKKYGKRCCDIAFSIIGLPFFILIFIPISVAIKLEDHGPVFYNAPRLGKNGKLFKMYKFRSMKINAPDIRLADGSTYNGEKDPRVTSVGKFLRKMSIDEFPQLINVLKGDMSFIGPRPDLKEDLKIYSEYEKLKLNIRPGITGYSQAYFRNSIGAHKKFKNDVFYVKNLSLKFDYKIIKKTIKTVAFRKKIYTNCDSIEIEKITTE